MTTEEDEYMDTDYTDKVPERVRTIAYFTAAIGAVLTAFAVGIVTLWVPDIQEQVVATGALVTTLLSGLAGALGVAYRPTR